MGKIGRNKKRKKTKPSQIIIDDDVELTWECDLEPFVWMPEVEFGLGITREQTVVTNSSLASERLKKCTTPNVSNNILKHVVDWQQCSLS